jgi:CheY-like chemotaxis protein
MLVTAYGREEIVQDAQAVGINDIILKPLVASLLFDSVMFALGRAADQQPSFIEKPHASQPIAGISGARVLLVEDNELNQQVAGELLADAGMIVDIADNGQIAVDKLIAAADDYYAIVLMDMQMPVMDGLSATREIRKHARFDHLPILAMTANAMQKDRDECLTAGMNAHLSKPIDPDAMWQSLQTWIKPVTNRATIAAAEKPNPAKVAQEQLAIPDDIPGLDTVNGLRRMLGKKALYLSILRKFMNSQANVVAEIRGALANEERNLAERLAHTVKGTADNIGATEIQQVAETIEGAIQALAPVATIEPHLELMQQHLDALLSALEAWLPRERNTESAADIDYSKLNALCKQLAALLEDDDPRAAKLASENSTLLKAAFPKHGRMLETEIRGFDFEDALKTLNDAIAATTPIDTPEQAVTGVDHE